MALPPKFVRSGEGAVASYDWTDLAEGTGIVLLYGVTDEDSTGESYVLTNDSNRRTVSITSTAVGGNSATYTKVMDLDFDYKIFNLPQNIGGTAFIQLPWAIRTSTAGRTFQVYMKAVFKKYDGSSETTLGTITSPTGDDSTQAYDERIALMSGELTKTHFKKGDLLRVTIEGWARYNPAGDPTEGTIAIGHCNQDYDESPFDVTGSPKTATTILKIEVPFNIDI